MSDPTVNAHLEGIISDFEALKRSFEVEEVDQSPNPSVQPRRTPNPLLRGAAAQKFQDPSTRNEPHLRHADIGGQRSPKSSLRRIELSGSRHPEPMSRRTEISIDISSKQVENSAPAMSRFGLKRAELSGHKPPEPPRRAEISLGKPHDLRGESPSSKIPELNQRKIEESNSKRIEIQVPKSPEVPPVKQVENSIPTPAVFHHQQEPKPQPVQIEIQQRTPEDTTEMISLSCASLGLYGVSSTGPKTRSTLRKKSNSGSTYRNNSSTSIKDLFFPTRDKPLPVGSDPAEALTLVKFIEDTQPYNVTMTDMIRDAGVKQPLPTRGVGDKPATDFGYVGIDAILEQMRKKAMKQGFELNIMVVGQSGLGKSTLINTLFKSKVSRKSVQPTPEERIPKTIEIKSITHDIEEKGVRMKLTVIDTPGFGDHINNENCWLPIMKFINDQYEKYLQEELNINRKKRIPDSRVHCCIYFIPATGHSLRPLDIEFMRRLSKVVNIVPVIAKADTLTLEERDYFKQRIRADLQNNGIDIYPQKEFDEDAEDRLVNEKIREMIPFAVVGSDQEYQINGRRILGRKTKWGTIEVENIAHCEFACLRDLLIRTHMQNIKDITSSIHFEAYRVKRLQEGNILSNGTAEKDYSSNEM